MRINKHNETAKESTGHQSNFVDVYSHGNRTMVLHGSLMGSAVLTTINSQQELSYFPLAGQTIIPANITQSKITTATDWVENNKNKLSKHSGKYVAITSKGIIAVSDDFDNVFLIAKQKGVINPLVFKVPKTSSRGKIVSVKSY